MRRCIPNITIGLIDGLTIPFALACGLSSIIVDSKTIFISCLAILIAYSITMTAGAYLSADKQPEGNALAAALTIGISYIAGGILVAVPFYFINIPMHALSYSASMAIPALFIAGYFDSRYQAANAWAGAVRVSLTGIIAGAAAFWIAGLFR